MILSFDDCRKVDLRVGIDHTVPNGGRLF